MEDMEFKKELLSLLKDMAVYFEKQDAKQERASLDKPPKVGETQKVLSGGDDPGVQPGQGVAKMDVEVPDNPKANEQMDISGEGANATKSPTVTDMKKVTKAEDDDKSESKKESEKAELSKLLKDIRGALQQSLTADQVKAIVSEEVKKAAPDLTQKMLHKMGFHPTKADVVRYGLDEAQDVKKSEEENKPEDIDPGLMKKAKDVEDMSKLPWHRLGELREKMGGFSPFPQ